MKYGMLSLCLRAKGDPTPCPSPPLPYGLLEPPPSLVGRALGRLCRRLSPGVFGQSRGGV